MSQAGREVNPGTAKDRLEPGQVGGKALSKSPGLLLVQSYQPSHHVGVARLGVTFRAAGQTQLSALLRLSETALCTSAASDQGKKKSAEHCIWKFSFVTC